MESTFENFSDDSKVWIYQSTSKIEDKDVLQINNILEKFCDGWMAHGNKMNAFAKIFYKQFILFFVDESQAEISGCGIDKSVHIVKEIGNQFGLNLFDRLKIAFINKNNEIEVTTKSQILKYLEGKFIDENTIVFNNVVSCKSSFNNEWKIPLKDSYLKQMLVDV